MKKSVVVVTAALALVGASLAFAAPVKLSDAQLDTVSAGQGVFDFVFGTGFTAEGDPVVAAVDTNAADNGSVAGNDNVVVPINVSDNTLLVTDVDEGGALATDSALAVGAEDNDGSALAQGTGNLALEDIDDSAFATADGSLAIGNPDDVAIASEGSLAVADTGDNAIAVHGGLALNDTDDNAIASGGSIAFADTDDTAIALGAGSVAFADTDDPAVALGEGNVALADVDDSIIAAGTGNIAQDIEIDADIETGGMGQVAYQATATNSFNRQEIEIDVEVDIEDSFNVVTNTLDISGQSGLTAIVNANSLSDQAIGVNLNIANASSQVPSAQAEVGTQPINAISGNALALTLLNQTVVNNSIIVGIGVLPVDGIATL